MRSRVNQVSVHAHESDEADLTEVCGHVPRAVAIDEKEL